MQTNVRVTTSKSLLTQTYHVSIDVSQTPEKVWEILISPNYPEWNSTVLDMSGEIQSGGQISLVSSAAPKQTFQLKVTQFEPHKLMVWESGKKPFFGGERRYTLGPLSENTCRFSMQETFQGLMMPVMQFILPDFTDNFKTFAQDLKIKAEG